MTFKFRLAAARTFVALAALALVGSLSQATLAQTQAQTPKRFGPGDTVVLPFNKNVWPQTYSDIAPDPAIRFGTLPNGMRYALMKNSTPSGQASLRMRLDTGSMMERDDQQGLAHFLEHMAFNGSKNIPEDELVKRLERLGLAFGADTNASTGHTQTIYQLDLPRTNDETVDAALMIMREQMSELLIAPEAVDRERGVVLSEERSRDSPGYRAAKAYYGFLLGDHIAVRRMPIGLPEILQNAPASAIADYWRGYYRPERATMVAVGDFDLDAMEAKIKAQFSSWVGQGPAGTDPALIIPSARSPEAKIFVEAGAPQSVTVDWVLPPDLDPDTMAERKDDLVTSMGLAVLNRRLERLARSPDAPFIGAGSSSSDFFRSAEVASLSIQPHDGRWRDGMTAAITEQRRIAEYGVGEAELQLELQQLRTGVQAAAARANTRTTPALANGIVGSLEAASVVSSPQQALARLDEMLEPITVAAVNARLRQIFAGSGPLVFISSPIAIEGSEATVLSALNAALTSPVQPGETLNVKAWPYTDFGAPGRVAAEEEILDLDAVFIRFENGVRLTVKPTKFREDSISVAVRFGSGFLSMPSDRVMPDWTLPVAFMEGGLKDLTQEEVEQATAGNVVGVSFGVGDDAFMLSGGTRPEDLNLQLQMLAAYMTQPGWRQEPFARMKAAYATAHDELERTASDVFSRDLDYLLHAGDKRWAFPSREEIANARFDDLRAMLEPSLAAGPIEIVIVGDTTVEKATAAVAATFGALPARPGPAWTTPPPAQVGFPAPNSEPVVLRHKGRPDQAVAFMAWRTDDFFADTHKARTLRVLGSIMRLRLIAELREAQGTTYSPQTSVAASSVFPDYGFAGALVETPPDKIPAFFAAVEEIAGALRNEPVTADELNRAKAPAIEALNRDFETNNFWLAQLSGAQADRRRLDSLRSARSGIQRVTAEDVQAMAREYLIPGQTWKLVVKAEGVE